MFAIKRYVLFNNEQKYDILNRLINQHLYIYVSADVDSLFD